MELIEAGTLSAFGTSAALLQPEPASRIGDGTPPPTTKNTAEDRSEPTLPELWKRARDSLDIAVKAAREDPLVAKQLYDFALYGCRSEESVRRLRETFAELQIPLDFLSQTKDQPPIT